MFFAAKRKPPAPPPAEIGGVRVVPSARARRLSLRLDARRGDVVLTLPPRVSLRRAEAFVAENQRWIEKHRAKAAAAQKTAPGMTLEFLGRSWKVAHMAGRGAQRMEDGVITIRGDAAHFPRRLRDFLKKEAEKTLLALAEEKTAALGLPLRAVRVIDPKSRWGSCGPDGRMMLSWRLALAPPAVMDYVVAHEAAHRVHMNHGRKFWALCATLTAADVKAARAWLRRHGDGLMRALQG